MNQNASELGSIDGFSRVEEGSAPSETDSIGGDNTEVSTLIELYNAANRIEHTLSDLCIEDGDTATFQITATNDGFGFQYGATVTVTKKDGKIRNYTIK